MVRIFIPNLAVVAALLLGAEASPCRPTTTTAISTAETTTLAAVTSATSIAASVVSTLTDVITESLEDTTTTVRADATTTTESESTMTTDAAACVETQLFINPGFDDSTSDIAPWTSNMNPIKNQPKSAPNALSAVFSNGEPDYYIKQSLENLNGDYEFSYYYKVVTISTGADYGCNIELKVGTATINGAMYDKVGGWKSGSVRWSSAGETVAQADVQFGLTCLGEFTGIEINVDTLAFTRVCSA
ncbi:hypothetical protein NW768_007612 [Fusarium equiseti]|uniref:CBM-cenC domain-containing protein n=1 Tax=Fusarium equiseti TaxID=61235 RepID=A0ABQ8R872_FUSEQ|nr:hypothetical protein NW768_007612 [Fusarium equiseti]